MANLLYPALKGYLMRGQIDLQSDTIKCMLVTSTYTPSVSHTKRSDLTNEIAGLGYTAGGIALAGKAVTQSGNNWIFTASNPAWTGLSISLPGIRGAVLYKARGGAANLDELIYYADLGTDYLITLGTFTVEMPATGIIL